MSDEHFPDFFATIPPIVMHDPLADLLGSATAGRLEYRYVDAVRLAGHSCPTVAGAWLMTTGALRALYPDAIPQRGHIAVSLPELLESGVAGVIASIATLITGAAGSGGFKGLAGQYARRGLLQFGTGGPAGLSFRRLDNGTAVRASFRPDSIKPASRLGELLPLILQGTARPEERQLFGQLWQARVGQLLAADNNPAVLEITQIN